MPELLEVEYYRRLAERCVGRRIVGVDAPDSWYLQGGLSAASLDAALVGRRVIGTARRGKLLMLEIEDAPTIGLRFGMTGRLVVDGEAAIEKLEYSSARNDPAWERFRLRFDDGGELRMVDPRRLGGVSLDPEAERLGPDAASATVSVLRSALGRSSTSLKARLLDQSRLAGLGNLLVDEILWRAKLAPGRPAGGLDDVELRRLHRVMRRTLTELDGRGGSHTGDLYGSRAEVGTVRVAVAG